MLEELVGSGGTVAAILRYTGTGKATGQALDVPAVHVWDLRDGRLARFRQFIDTVKYAEVVPAGVATTA
jgi:ketosteroid isomerase-like protein